MATFAPKGRIDIATVDNEVARLQRLWSGSAERGDGLDAVLNAGQLTEIDPFDRVQLAYAVEVCRESASLSEAGRRLFAASRERRASTNDADRLRKYLARFGVEFAMLGQSSRSPR
jgi:transcriptional regulatory protein RtcR